MQRRWYKCYAWMWCRENVCCASCIIKWMCACIIHYNVMFTCTLLRSHPESKMTLGGISTLLLHTYLFYFTINNCRPLACTSFCDCIITGVYFSQDKNKPWVPWVYTWFWNCREQQCPMFILSMKLLIVRTLVPCFYSKILQIMSNNLWFSGPFAVT